MQPTQTSQADRISRCRSVKKRVILACEGNVTEIKYFDALIKHRDTLKLSPLISIVLLKRYAVQDGLSRPQKVAEFTHEYLNAAECGVYSLRLFAGTMVETAFSDMKKHDPMAEQTLLRDIENELSSAGMVNGGNIVTLKKATECCGELIAKVTGKTGIALPTIELDYEPDIDEVYIVADRDKATSNTVGQFNDFLSECRKFGFHPIVTNPRFELWILMHFEIDDLLQKLKSREKCSSVVTQELKNRGITGKHIDGDMIIEHLDQALKNSSFFCQNINHLSNEIGTNLPELIKQLRAG